MEKKQNGKNKKEKHNKYKEKERKKQKEMSSFVCVCYALFEVEGGNGFFRVEDVSLTYQSTADGRFNEV